MKVLFVSSGNSHYGVVPFIKVQGEAIRKFGVDVDFYTIKGKGVKGYLQNIIPLRKYILNNNYDIIHAHYGLIGLLCILTFSKRPVVLSIMGSDAYGSFDINGKRIKLSYFIMFLTQIAILFSKKVIVKSRNLYNFIYFKRKTYIIPNGVDLEVFKPYDYSLKKNKVLWLANPKEPRKNYKLFNEAISLINKHDVEIVTPYSIKHEEFPEFINASSVFVLTSYNEGSPNVIKEAMACNIPIVSTDVGDVKEIIGNTDGCYITSFAPEDVAEKIKMALKFAKIKGRTKGRERIKELGLDSETVAKNIIEVYKKVLKN